MIGRRGFAHRIHAARRSRSTRAVFVVACVCAIPSLWPRDANADAAAEPKLQISKSASKLDPALVRGFAAYGVGDLAGAEREYAMALKAEPRNPDALHGAAMIALRKGDRERAAAFLRRAVVANPQDATAVAHLVAMAGPADPIAAETRLKSLIATQPDEPALRFALGTIYATAGRWREAQQAFFSAYSAAPEQPDTLFNLAVSLDHLHQPKLAREFYEKALLAAKQRPAAFDPFQAAVRLRELQP